MKKTKKKTSRKTTRTTEKQNKDKLTRAEKHLKMSGIAIIITGIGFVLTFLCMSVYMVRYADRHEIEMFDNSYNSYAKRLSKEYLRGDIYSSDGVLLAYSEGDDPEKQTRVYPYANLYAHSIGYSSHGRMGVESEANYYLLNYNSGIGQKVSAGADSSALKADSVYTTIDSALQQTAYDSLGVYKGAVIITEVSTGRILAMVSKPDFDPNDIDNLWDDMLSDKNNSSLLNRVTQGQYPPGSTFKMITALEYLRENNLSYSGYHFNCTGSYTYEDTKIQCYHGSVHGNVDFSTAFAKSCNSAFANIGMSLDKAKFSETLNGLLFETELPYDLPSSVSHTPINADTDSHNMMQASIGQGQDSISPLHLNMITCAIANDGVLMKPHMIDRVESVSGHVVEEFKPVRYGTLMTEEESSMLTDLMTEVVEKGTATRLKDRPYTAAGKTGSAEFLTMNNGDSHAWFTGFAPAEDPEIAVTIIIEGAGSGGEYAVPVAGRMFDTYFEGRDMSTESTSE